MKNRKQAVSENYLERRPRRPENLHWSADEDGIVTLYLEHTGIINCIAQKVFRRPKITRITLDGTGSFIWPLLDGYRDILSLGILVEAEFGEKVNPLYERLAKYFQILDSYQLIEWGIRQKPAPTGT